MFGLTKKVHTGESITLKIDGMHCVSCAMNIDGELEELDGVSSAETNYAKGITEVIYDPANVDIERISQVIENLGYEIESNY